MNGSLVRSFLRSFGLSFVRSLGRLFSTAAKSTIPSQVKPSYLHPVSVVDAVNGILETVDLYGDVWPTFLFPEFPDSDQINAYNTEHPQGPANPRVVSSYTNFLNGALGRGNPEILLGVLEHILKKKPSVGSKLTRKTPAEVRAALVDPDADFFPPVRTLPVKVFLHPSI